MKNDEQLIFEDMKFDFKILGIDLYRYKDKEGYYLVRPVADSKFEIFRRESSINNLERYLDSIFPSFLEYGIVPENLLIGKK